MATRQTAEQVRGPAEIALLRTESDGDGRDARGLRTAPAAYAYLAQQERLRRDRLTRPLDWATWLCAAVALVALVASVAAQVGRMVSR